MLKGGKCVLVGVAAARRTQVCGVRRRPYPVSFINYLRNTPHTNLQTTRLCNGLTVATEERECPSACIGIYVDAGPIYESDFENGATHFFEHIAFKGTFARTRALLEDQMLCLGARFRCFTRRDMAAYYAQCLALDVPLVVDILADSVFNNSFDPAEIELQKNVVYEEMLQHDSDHDALLDDYLHEAAFQGTPLARSVMGPSCNLYNFNCNTLPTYMNRFYDAERTVLVGVGGVRHEQMVALGNTYLGRLEPTKCFECRSYRFSGSDVRYRNDSMPAANVVIAVEGPCLCDDDFVVMEVAAEAVGGWDRSQPGGVDLTSDVAALMSAQPFCDAYRAISLGYRDTGLWGVQFSGPTRGLDDATLLVQNQWLHLCNSVTETELEGPRRALKSKILSRAESMTRTCHDVGRWLLYGGKRPPLDQRLCAVDNVRVADVRAAMTRYVYDRCPVVAAIGPTEGLNDYVRIRDGMYWLRL